MNSDKKIDQLIQSASTCFLASVTSEGYPMIRAMLTPIKIDNNLFYLHTNTASKKVRQFLKNEKACFYFCEQNQFRGLAILGEVELIFDDNKKTFWKKEYEGYYAQGEGLSDFTVVKFKGKKAEYYQEFKVTTLFINKND